MRAVAGKCGGIENIFLSLYLSALHSDYMFFSFITTTYGDIIFQKFIEFCGKFIENRIICISLVPEPMSAPPHFAKFDSVWGGRVRLLRSRPVIRRHVKTSRPFASTPSGAGEIAFPRCAHDTAVPDFRAYGNCGELRLDFERGGLRLVTRPAAFCLLINASVGKNICVP